jgi:hypothetical protein
MVGLFVLVGLIGMVLLAVVHDHRVGQPFAGAAAGIALGAVLGLTAGPVYQPLADEAEPPRSRGTAMLSGSMVGSFQLEGDCPTPDEPDGYMIGEGTVDGHAAELDVSFLVDAVGFGTWPPGDKEGRVGGLAPLTFEPLDDGGWRVLAEAELEGAGPVTLEVRWTCGG